MWKKLSLIVSKPAWPRPACQHASCRTRSLHARSARPRRCRHNKGNSRAHATPRSLRKCYFTPYFIALFIPPAPTGHQLVPRIARYRIAEAKRRRRHRRPGDTINAPFAAISRHVAAVAALAPRRQQKGRRRDHGRLAQTTLPEHWLLCYLSSRLHRLGRLVHLCQLVLAVQALHL